MGRPEKPIPPQVPSATRELLLYLREVRAASGLTLRELAARGPATAATLSRITSASRAPSWQAVSVFADAVQMDTAGRAKLKELWERARAETTPPTSTAAREDAAPSVSESMWSSTHTLRAHHKDYDRSRTLADLYMTAGSPSLRQLAEKSGHPRSTVHRAIRGQSLAGAADIAQVLLSYLPRERRRSWAAEVDWLFRSSPTDPAPVPPLFQVKEGAAPQAAQAVAEFKRALQVLRNYVVHGDVDLSPQLAVQVMQLQVTLEQAPSTGSGQSAPPQHWTDIEGHSAPSEEDEGIADITETSDVEVVTVPHSSPYPISIPLPSKHFDDPSGSLPTEAPNSAEDKR
ncbi:helix-turn-helix domain-containing protein [Streptomyces mirabilis]